MSGFVAVTVRELRALVRQPVAWVITGLFLLVHGIFFLQMLERYSNDSLRLLSGATAVEFTLVDRIVRPLLVGDTFVLMLLLPALTMRQLAEEWRSGTSDLLLTYPLTETQIVLGKFTAAAAVSAVMIGLASLYPLAAALFGYVELPVWGLGHVGLFLYVLTVLAIGLMMSATTDNQVIAFSATFALLLAISVSGNWGVQAREPWDLVFRMMSFTGHVAHFADGVWRLSSTVFFGGQIVLFLYVAVAVLGRRRWRTGGRSAS